MKEPPAYVISYDATGRNLVITCSVHGVFYNEQKTDEWPVTALESSTEHKRTEHVQQKKVVSLMHPDIEALEEIPPQDFKNWVYSLSNTDQRTLEVVALGLLMDDEDLTAGKQRAVITYAFEKAKQQEKK